MATNWTAYEAAKELMGNNKETIAEIGSRFPLFTRTVSMENSKYLLEILKAVSPKVTARIVETGLANNGQDDEEEETTEQVVKKAEKATEKKAAKEEAEPEEDAEEEEAGDYEGMTSKALYKLCCDRGISSQCKKRDKASLIAVLKANDDADDWDDEEEEEENKDPYAGKSAKELFKMCTDRKIKTKPKQSADVYAKLLKKADADAAATEEDEDEEDDDWEI
jgi:hypothetical protein